MTDVKLLVLYKQYLKPFNSAQNKRLMLNC